MVIANSHFSEFEDVISGVTPSGLSPWALLFAIYVNDLTYHFVLTAHCCYLRMILKYCISLILIECCSVTS